MDEVDVDAGMGPGDEHPLEVRHEARSQRRLAPARHHPAPPTPRGPTPGARRTCDVNADTGMGLGHEHPPRYLKKLSRY
jgi:hypothetical protein